MSITKKLAAIAMAAMMTTAMAVTASADTISTAETVATPYGTLGGTLSKKEGWWFWDNSKTFTATSTCSGKAPTLTVELEVVSYPSGTRIFNSSNRATNATTVSVSSEGITKSDTVSAYGAHQVIYSDADVTYTAATAV